MIREGQPDAEELERKLAEKEAEVSRLADENKVLRYHLREIAGTLAEYRDIPVASTRNRMLQAIDRAANYAQGANND